VATAKRETKQQFWSRVESEGRLEVTEALRVELANSGMSKREIQAMLVARFQPLDGTETRAWPTPNSWENGRQYWRNPPRNADDQLAVDLLWVYNNYGKQSSDDAPTPGARMLMDIAQKRPGDFFKSVFLKRLCNTVSHQRDQNYAKRRKQPMPAKKTAKRAS
jgi:hypothetical protein